MRDSAGSGVVAGAVKTSSGLARSSASSAVISLVVLAIDALAVGALREHHGAVAGVDDDRGLRARHPRRVLRGAGGGSRGRSQDGCDGERAASGPSLAQLDLLAGDERLRVELGVQLLEPLDRRAVFVGDPAEGVVRLDRVGGRLAASPCVSPVVVRSVAAGRLARVRAVVVPRRRRRRPIRAPWPTTTTAKAISASGASRRAKLVVRDRASVPYPSCGTGQDRRERGSSGAVGRICPLDLDARPRSARASRRQRAAPPPPPPPPRRGRRRARRGRSRSSARP